MGIQSHLRTSVLAIEDDQQHRHLFISNVLPFGPSISVYAFNLIARSLHIIGASLFAFIWSDYYDGFPQLNLAACEADSLEPENF